MKIGLNLGPYDLKDKYGHVKVNMTKNTIKYDQMSVNIGQSGSMRVNMDR